MKLTKFFQLSKDEMRIIERLVRAKKSKSQIAKILGRHRSTIGRLVNKKENTDFVKVGGKIKRTFSAERAQKNYTKNKSKCGAKYKLFNYPELIQILEDKVINSKWSPENVIGFLNDNGAQVNITDRSIYNYIAREQLNITPFHLRFKLRRKKPKREHIREHKRKLGRSITERPFKYERNEFGHFEADCLCDKYNNAVLVIQERMTRFGFMLELKKHDSENTQRQIKELFKEYGHAFKSITCDNGFEFFRLPELETEQFKVYFSHPYSPHEKGGVENLNGIIRRYIPNGKNISTLTAQTIRSIASHINSIPRKILNFKTPASLFEKHLAAA